MNITAMVAKGLLETLYMTVAATVLAYVLGLPLGVLLTVTDRQGIRPMAVVHKCANIAVNVLRSVPFLILLIAVMPLTKLIVGTTIGSSATVVPLVIAAFPFIARLVEASLREVDKGVVEAAQSMGAGNMQIIVKVLLHEARPSLLVQAAIATTTILSFSAMAGIVGGGGLGAIAINYGYYRNNREIMFIMVAVLVVVVQVLQAIGMWVATKSNKRTR